METTEQKMIQFSIRLIEKEVLRERLRSSIIHIIGEIEKIDEMIDIMISVLTSDYDDDQYYEFIPETVRQAMQMIGTECFRKIIGEDVFINKLFNDYKDQNIVISDIRFKNECEAVKKHGGMIFHVDRKSIVNNDEHISESGIDINNADICIVNNYSIDALRDNIKSILQLLNYIGNNVICNLMI